MDINDGALSFDMLINTIDLEKTIKVVEDRIIGMADKLEKESASLDNAVSAGLNVMAEQIKLRKELIGSLEDQYNKVSTAIAETPIEIGTEESFVEVKKHLSEVSDALIDQRESLEFLEVAYEKESKKAVQSVSEIAQAAKEVSKEISIMYDMPATADQFKESIDAQKSAIINLETEITKTRDAISNLKPNKDWGQNPAKYDALIQKSAVLRSDLRDEKKALSELEKGYIKLTSEQEKAEKAQGQLSQKVVTYMTQLRKIREEMIGLEMEGKKESPRYRELQSELEKTGTAYRKVQQEQKYLTTAGSATISGLLQGMSLVSGAFSAGSGVMSLFVKDNEKLAAIQTKLQAAMAITIGLQQVSTALHSTSSFRMNVVTKVTSTFAAANTRLAVGLGISTLAAKVLMATLTLGLSVAITGIIYLVDKVISKQKELSEQAKKNAEKLEQYNKSVADSASAPIAAYKRLQAEWDTLTGDLKKKEKFVKDNKSEFASLGLEINNVVEAENALVENTEAVINSLSLKARAMATQSLAVETYKEAIQKQIEAESRGKKPTKQEFVHSKAVYEYKDVDGQKNVPHYIGTEASIEAGKKIQDEADKLFEKADNLTKDQIKLLEKARQELKKGNITPSEKTDKPTKAISDNYAKAILAQEEKLNQERITLERSRIDDKQELIDFDLKQTIAKINKEKEESEKVAKKENKEFKGAVFDDRINVATQQSVDAKQAIIDEANAKEAKANEEAAKKFLTIEQQKAEVRKTYADLAKKYTEIGLGDRVALIKEEEEQILGELSAMEIQGSAMWKNLFDNMDNLSESAVNDIIAKLRELVNNIENVDIKNALNKQLDDAKSPIDSKNPFSRLTNGIKEYKEASDEASKDKAIKNIGESAKDMADLVTDSLGSVVNGLKDLGMMDEGTEKIFGDVMGLVGGMGDLAAGYASMNPAQMIQGTVGIITSAFSLFDSKSRDIERKIKEHKKQLVELGRVYKDIEYQVNNSVGEDYYSGQFKAIENLKKQQKEVAGLLYQEERKKKKDKDEDAINNYKDQLADIPRQIQDIEREIAETLVQTSFKDMSSQLADALVSAFEAGEGAAEDFDKTFNKVIANAVRNSLKMKILEKPINDFTESLSNFMLENQNSAAGFDFEKWRNILKDAGKSFTSGLEEFDKYFDIDGTDRQGTTGGFAQASQDSINELNGLMYAARQMIGDIRNDNREDLLIQRSIVGYLIVIAENTGHLKAVQQSLNNIDSYGIKMKV